MTTETETQIDTAALALTPSQLASIASLGVFTAKNDVMQVLTGIHLSVGNGLLTAMVTDRYRVARLIMPVDHTGADTSALIPAKALADFSKSAKSVKTYAASTSITLEFSETGYLIKDALTQASAAGATVAGNFPPMNKMFVEFENNQNSIDLAPVGINPTMFGDLAKLIDPQGKKLADHWTVEFRMTATDRIAPIRASFEGDNGAWSITALIQPRLAVR